MKNLAYLFLIFGIVSCGVDNNTIVTEKLTETQSSDIAKIEVTAEYPKTAKSACSVHTAYYSDHFKM